MKKHRFILCALLAFALTLTLCACGGAGEETHTGESAAAETESGEDETSGETGGATTLLDFTGDSQDCIILSQEEYEARPRGIQEGTVLRYAVWRDVPSQFPWDASDAGWLWGNIYEGLLYMYMNDPEDIRGCIAESWEHSDDYLTWTFNIREGVEFTDGTVCDADAISKAWDCVEQILPNTFTQWNIASWEAAGAAEFVVRLSAPCACFEAALCEPALLAVSPTALDLYGTGDNKAAVGTGPYYISSYTRGEGIVLRANTDYRFEEKMPCIETADIRFFRDQDIVIDALLSRELDGTCFRTTDGYYYNKGEDDNIPAAYLDILDGGYDGTLATCLGGSKALLLNADWVPVFRDIEVREALCRFIDFDAINDLLYAGMGRVQDSMWEYGTQWYVPSDQYYYDPSEGEALLASVGITPYDIVFRMTTFGGSGEKLFEWQTNYMFYFIQDQLAEVGIHMSINVQGPETSSVYPIDGKWSIFSLGSAGSRSAAPYVMWSYIFPQDTLIKACWQDVYDPALYQRMKDEYDAMRGAATWDVMLTHGKKLTAYEQDDFGVIAGIQPPALVALSKDFKNGVYFSAQHDIQLYYLCQ